jgi:hypothetical protein
MKKFITLPTISILILLVLLAANNLFKKQKQVKGDIIKVDGKKYEVVKHIIDTFEIIKTDIVERKGEDIYHEVLVHDTIEKIQPVDTLFIVRDYLSKYIYKDTLYLKDSLGIVWITDTISANKIVSRTWSYNIKERLVKESTIVKELPKIQLYFGFNTSLNKQDLFQSVGSGLILKTRSDKLFQVTVGLNNQLKPFVEGGLYWKIKLKK